MMQPRHTANTIGDSPSHSGNLVIATTYSQFSSYRKHSSNSQKNRSDLLAREFNDTMRSIEARPCPIADEGNLIKMKYRVSPPGIIKIIDVRRESEHVWKRGLLLTFRWGEWSQILPYIPLCREARQTRPLPWGRSSCLSAPRTISHSVGFQIDSYRSSIPVHFSPHVFVRCVTTGLH